MLYEKLTYFYGYIGVALSMLLGEILGLFFIFFVPSKILNKKLFPIIKYDILKYLAIGFIFSFLYFNLKFIFKSYELFIYQFCLTIVLMLLYIILILLFKLISINEIKLCPNDSKCSPYINYMGKNHPFLIFDHGETTGTQGLGSIYNIDGQVFIDMISFSNEQVNVGETRFIKEKEKNYQNQELIKWKWKSCIQ